MNPSYLFPRLHYVEYRGKRAWFWSTWRYKELIREDAQAAWALKYRAEIPTLDHTYVRSLRIDGE